MKKAVIKSFLPLALAALLGMAGCGSGSTGTTGSDNSAATEESANAETASTENGSLSGEDRLAKSSEIAVSLDEIPDYDGDAWIVLNDNVPFFSDEEKTTDVFEEYSDLDELGRCGTAYANICQELMPTEKRGDISEIHPTGWQSSRYDFVDGESLYNRCHLIAHELAGENANEKNLITGTRYFNIDGMQDFENMVTDYVKETGNHVLYRVTPLFEGDDLVARGAVMEAYSVEDEGDGICYCVYAYNVQPGVTIDYATGDNWLASDSSGTADSSGTTNFSETSASDTEGTYILNTNSMKFHRPDCEGVSEISERNKQEYTGSRSDLIAQGYSPCGTCNP